jgi:hypothetical protein
LYALTWKAWVTPSGHSLSRLRASVRRTSETERTGWPTPVAHEARLGYQRRRGDTNGSQESLTTVVVNMLAPDSDPRLEGLTLSGWPTPVCQSPSSLRGRGQDPDKRKAQGHQVNLTDAVNWVRDCERAARLTATGELLTGSLAGMESGGQLNPAHSRWLMGYPPAWDACAVTAMPSSRKPRQSSSKPSHE